MHLSVYPKKREAVTISLFLFFFVPRNLNFNSISQINNRTFAGLTNLRTL